MPPEGFETAIPVSEQPKTKESAVIMKIVKFL
jgi:hypothetical protein